MEQDPMTGTIQPQEEPELPNERGKKRSYSRLRIFLATAGAIGLIVLVIAVPLMTRRIDVSCAPTNLTTNYHMRNATITWRSENANCQYLIHFRKDQDNKTHEVYVNGTEYVLHGNFGDCSILHVNVSAVTTGKVTENHVSGIFAVTPIDTTIYDLHMEKPVDNTALVTWHSPTEHLLCDRLYTINTTNSIPEKNLSNTCRGISSCEITLGDFCPGVYIVAVATSIHGTIMPNAEEVTAHFTHVCGQNVDVKQRNRRP